MIIFYYISKELYTTLLGIIMVLLIIFMTNQFIHFLHYAASGHITMNAVMRLMSLQVPFLLGYLMPLGLYLSILIVFGRLYLDHEMTVLYAGGVSPNNLLSIVLVAGILVTAVVGGLMLWLEPLLDAQRTRIFYDSVATATVEKIMPKRFQVLGSERVFYADSVDRDQLKMRDIFFAQRNKPKADGSRSWDITIAKSAQESYQDNGHFLTFENGFRYLGVPGSYNFEIVQYQTYGIRMTQAVANNRGWPANASTLSLWPMRHDPKAASELHWRMAMPISAFVLALLAFPLSKINPRQGKFSRLIPAILLYIIYGNLLFLGRAWIRKGVIDFNVGLWWLHGIMAILAIGLMFYQRFKNAYT